MFLVDVATAVSEIAIAFSLSVAILLLAFTRLLSSSSAKSKTTEARIPPLVSGIASVTNNLNNLLASSTGSGNNGGVTSGPVGGGSTGGADNGGVTSGQIGSGTSHTHAMSHGHPCGGQFHTHAEVHQHPIV